MFLFANFVPTILLTVSQGDIRKKQGNWQNPVQTSTHAKDRSQVLPCEVVSVLPRHGAEGFCSGTKKMLC